MSFQVTTMDEVNKSAKKVGRREPDPRIVEFTSAARKLKVGQALKVPVENGDNLDTVIRRIKRWIRQADLPQTLRVRVATDEKSLFVVCKETPAKSTK